MSLIEAVLRERHCLQCGRLLHGKEYACLSCRSLLRGLLEGDMTSDGQPIDARDFLRRKLDDIANHRLSPAVLARSAGMGFEHRVVGPRDAPRVMLRAREGYADRGATGLTGGRLALAGETIQWQAKQRLARRIVDGMAHPIPMLADAPLPGSAL